MHVAIAIKNTRYELCFHFGKIFCPTHYSSERNFFHFGNKSHSVQNKRYSDNIGGNQLSRDSNVSTNSVTPSPSLKRFAKHQIPAVGNCACNSKDHKTSRNRKQNKFSFIHFCADLLLRGSFWSIFGTPFGDFTMIAIKENFWHFHATEFCWTSILRILVIIAIREALNFGARFPA